MSDLPILGSDPEGARSDDGSGPSGVTSAYGGSRDPLRRRRRPRYVAPVVSLVVVALVGLAAFVGARSLYHHFSSTPDYDGAGSGTAYVQINVGDTADDIGNAMVTVGVVKSVRAFRRVASDDPRSRSIQPGRYALRKRMSGQSALALLLDPASHIGRVTVPEGLTEAETLARLARATTLPLAQLQSAARDASGLGLPGYSGGHVEGYLYPTTYDLPARSSAAEILRTIVSEQRTQVDAGGLREGARRLAVTPGQVIVVASLLEQEGVTADFPKVSRVIYNRLAMGRALQLDSTVNYALGRNKVRVTEAQTRTASPYNTYLNRGLPPGPICSPGNQAIQAALHPVEGNWIYFVKADRAGNSFFTDDPAAFAAQKKKSRAEGVY